jgi:hypothetical protein
MLLNAIAFLLLVPGTARTSLSVGPGQDRCPLRIEVTADGAFFTNRFRGRYKTGPKLLESDLRAGCYNDNDPAPVSSVQVSIEPGAPPNRVSLLYRILETNGWPKSKIQIQAPRQ